MLFEGAEAGLRGSLGAGHPSVLRALVGLATTTRNSGELAEAEALFQSALEGYAAKTDGDALVAKHGLAETLRREGRLTDAEAMFAEVVSVARRTLPAGHWQCAVFESDWARCLFELMRFDEAGPLIIASSAALERTLGPERPQTQRALALLAEVRRGR